MVNVVDKFHVTIKGDMFLIYHVYVDMEFEDREYMNTIVKEVKLILFPFLFIEYTRFL